MLQILFGHRCVFVSLAGNTLAQTPAPNIVFILVDDMVWNGPACYGSDLHETPNIDRLASEGVRFTQAYSASPVCSPTRASMTTGKHPARLHMTTWHESAVSRLTDPGTEKLAEPLTEPSLGLEYVTLAEALHTAGYQTAHVGKWHLGDAERYPEAQGFDVNIGGTLWGAPATYWYPYQSERKTDAGTLEHRYVPGLSFGAEGDYLTDRLTTEALHLLDKMQGKPFFLNLCYHNPHTPIEGKPELVAYYEQKRRDGMTHTNAHYAAMVHSLDQNVGRLLQKLDELGLAKNTVVLFLRSRQRRLRSGAPGRAGDKQRAPALGEGLPLRRRHSRAFHRALARVTPRGVTCDTPVVSTDCYPTLLEAASLSAEAVKCGVLDGVSLRPLLAHPDQPLSRDALFWHYPHYYFNTGPVTAMRWQAWKLLEYYEDGRLELYNLNDDLEEQTDLAGVHPGTREGDAHPSSAVAAGAQRPAARAQQRGGTTSRESEAIVCSSPDFEQPCFWIGGRRRCVCPGEHHAKTSTPAGHRRAAARFGSAPEHAGPITPALPVADTPFMEHVRGTLTGEEEAAFGEKAPASSLKGVDAVITTSFVTQGGLAWLGTDDGLYFGADGAFQRHPSYGVAGPLSNRIAGLAADTRGVLWVATPAGPSARDAAGAWRLFRGREGLPWEELTAIAIDATDRIWLGSTRGLIQYRPYETGRQWYYRAGEAPFARRSCDPRGTERRWPHGLCAHGEGLGED